MKTISLRLCALLLALTATGTALADHNFGVGVKAGTLGIGVEGTWRPLPYIDLRLGTNQYDYSDSGLYGGVNYDAEINLDNYYVTGNLRFPLSPFRRCGALTCARVSWWRTGSTVSDQRKLKTKPRLTTGQTL